ncbi:MAG: hopanoid biosynthesis associated RND transporter like protein HpnN [Gammaproteobacteria bacterium]|jgi:hopanoid biosynthesis associated RND transporter like protein HpnN
MILSKNTSLSILNKYITLVETYRLAILALFILLATTALVYTINNLGMSTDTKDMLSPELSWRKLDLEYEKYFPQNIDDILVVVNADTPDQSADSANIIFSELMKDSSQFKTIYYPKSLSIFRENGLLFLSEEELFELSDNLAKIQPFLTRLTDDMSLRGLFNMLSDALDALKNGENINIEPVITEISNSIQANIDEKPIRVSWQNLIDNKSESSEKQNHEFIILQPTIDYSDMLPATEAINKVREISLLPSVVETGASVRLTGGAVLAHEELLSVSRGMGTALLLSISMVTLIMILGLNSIRLVAFTLISLVTGLLLTAAFATLAIGELNLISVAFAVLYIGLGIDFAIHYCLRYREFHLLGSTNILAIGETSRNLGQSLIICTITTAIGFFAFIPTDYRGVAELGLISGVGMFISLFVTMTLLPALLWTFPLSSATRNNSSSQPARITWLTNLPMIHARKLILVAAVITILSLGLAINVQFDSNILNLQDPENESVQTYASLLESSDTSPWTGVIIAKDRDDAIKTINNIEQQPVVDKVVWLDDFIPESQDEKLAIIDELNLLLPGGFPDTALSSSLSSNEQYQVLTSFLDKYVSTTVVTENNYLLNFTKALQIYVDKLSSMSTEQQADALNDLSKSLLASLPGRLNLLNASLQADTISEENLPLDLKERWQSADGHFLLSIYPKENLNNNYEMRRFVDELYRADPRIIGAPVVNIEAGDAVISAFIEALTYAICAIALFLLVLLPHKFDVLLILSTLIFAVIVTAGISTLLNIPLNFANIIALPLLLGMGVDSGIHILHRYRTALPEHNNILATSSARAVIVSALTTMCSIGTLTFSPHAGTASMGNLLGIGIAMTLIATLFVLPGLLKQVSK